MTRKARFTVLCAFAVVLGYGHAAGQITFTRIVDTETYAPGTGETFSSFTRFSVRNDTVVFKGETFSGHRGIYLVRGGVLEVVLEQGMVLPGIGVITQVANPSFDGVGVAIDTDSHSGFHGILVCTGDEVQVVAQRGDPIPDSEHEVYDVGVPRSTTGRLRSTGPRTTRRRTASESTSGMATTLAPSLIRIHRSPETKALSGRSG